MLPVEHCDPRAVITIEFAESSRKGGGGFAIDGVSNFWPAHYHRGDVSLFLYQYRHTSSFWIASWIGCPGLIRLQGCAGRVSFRSTFPLWRSPGRSGGAA